MNDKQPSILKIAWIDYWAFISAAFCLVAMGIYIYHLFLSGNPTHNFIGVALGIFVLGLLGMAWRYISIVSLYNSGLETKGTISEIGFFRDRGYIKYIYPYENRKYAGHVTVMKNRTTTRYKIGNEIEVIVDRENPKKSLIKDLYT
ncbi:MAG TPA: DUF3592 domain-containing protein [Anaerolineales bacterium]|nr:DUF3592 domain-containing protein [Anaerolineales bacterium]HLO34195.1 DUF3592 domain-containing protein [Anaerolineales bacterium]